MDQCGEILGKLVHFRDTYDSFHPLYKPTIDLLYVVGEHLHWLGVERLRPDRFDIYTEQL